MSFHSDCMHAQLHAMSSPATHSPRLVLGRRRLTSCSQQQQQRGPCSACNLIARGSCLVTARPRQSQSPTVSEGLLRSRTWPCWRGNVLERSAEGLRDRMLYSKPFFAVPRGCAVHHRTVVGHPWERTDLAQAPSDRGCETCRYRWLGSGAGDRGKLCHLHGRQPRQSFLSSVLLLPRRCRRHGAQLVVTVHDDLID